MRLSIVIALSLFMVYPGQLLCQNAQSLNLHGGAYLLKLDKKKALDNYILQICDFFEKSTQIKLSVYKTNIGPIFSHPQLGVVINERELQNMGRQLGSTSMNDIITLIVCHEISHIQQFKDAANGRYSSSFKKLWECQADILSGYYFARYCIDGDNLGSLHDIDREMATLFYFENDKYGLSNYPDIHQRVSAVNAGIRMALSADTSKQMAPDKKDLLSSSLLQAEKIINYCQRASQDIILDSSKVNIDAEKRIARFYLSYRNSGKDSITMDFSVQAERTAGMFDRGDDEFERDKIVNSKDYLFTIGPGKSISFFDSLQLGSNSNVIIRFPPMANSQGRFISGSCTEGEEYVISLLRNYKLKFTDVTLNAISIDDIIDIVYSQSKALMQGPGIKRSTGIWYHSMYAFPGSVENNFIMRNGRIMFSSLVQQGTDVEQCREKLDMETESITSALHLLGITFREESFDVDDTDEDTELVLEKLNIRILIRLQSDLEERSYYSNHSRNVRKVRVNPRILVQVINIRP